ncbi:hypothetical protein H6P81_001844 [Aristolochia fimbriata]|uniref:Cytochrome b561 domain-containing protein n=1 Tax=Aristolochia fimbriata TaxID=158543 RepID=A0AAV7FBW4_ARIFI|nr:hypothetical protein H6P81_001844 [Aristolochia fimbriata]
MAAKASGSLLSATPVTVIAHFLGIAITTLVLVWIFHFEHGLALSSENKQKIFNVHPVLMLIGFVFIIGEGIMAYKTVPSTRRVQKLVHMILLLMALVLGVLGIYAVFKFRNEVGIPAIPNMRTLHSWLGMGTICLFGFQWLLAFFSFFFPGAEIGTRARVAPWHTFMGVVIFLMAICTAEAGLTEAFIFLGLNHGKEAFVVNFTGIAVLLFGIAVTLALILP